MTNDRERLTHGDVERIVQLVEDAGFGYLRLEVDGVELTLTKGDGVDQSVAAAGGAAAPAALEVPAAAPAAAPARPASATGDGPASGEPPALTSATPGTDDAGLVRSPMVGIFYRAPDPESPPYVEPGQSVEAGDTIGLVEVMKMYTAIRAETGGTVVEVFADNAQQVDRGQPLVRIQGR